MSYRYRLSSNNRLAFTFVLIAVGIAFNTTANASGVETPEDNFVARQYSDVDTDRYQAGELGVVLPSYSRAYLYPAWRAIVLGRKGVQVNTTKDGLRRAQADSDPLGWVPANEEGAANVAQRWMQASQEYAGPNRLAIVQGFRQTANGYSSYVICPSPAFKFAIDTLNELTKRKDATPAHLRAWVLAQDQVFAFCDYDKNSKRGPNGGPTLRPQALSPLPTTEPIYWQQLRGYQIAAAAFYADDFNDSFKQFSTIGADKNHPMYVWGAYLALRSKARSADLDTEPGDIRVAIRAELKKAESTGDGSETTQARIAVLKKKLEQQDEILYAKELAEISAQVKRIVDDSSLAIVHEASKATLRIMQARLFPAARFDELSSYLDDTTHNPYESDHFADWTILANEVLTYSDEKGIESGLRKKYAFFDWIDSLQKCSNGVQESLWQNPMPAKAAEVCRREYNHAITRWKAGATAKKSNSANDANVWLVAALMLADSLTSELESAALRVPSDAPEYLTVRYNLVRLYRIKGEFDKARKMGEEELAFAKEHVPDSVSAENLFKQERFAVATSVNDALMYLMRRPTKSGDAIDPATSKDRSSETPLRLAGDGQRWLNSQLGVQEILNIAQDVRLDPQVRSQIAISAWIRADLLQNISVAHDAALLVARTVPQLKAAAERYDSLSKPDEKRQALIVTMLKYDMHALVRSYPLNLPDKLDLKSVQENATASAWCHIPFALESVASDGRILDNLEEHLPDPLTVSADAATRDREILALGKLKTATGFIGDHMMQWAKAHPNDPEVPWLLHVVVQSTRGGCLDADSSKLSRAAYSLLHSRYKTSEWTAKTRVWY